MCLYTVIKKVCGFMVIMMLLLNNLYSDQLKGSNLKKYLACCLQWTLVKCCWWYKNI